MFGELEFWLALVKVCAIVLLIGVGLVCCYTQSMLAGRP